MKISGFTFVRNATKYYFPIKESILSVLDIVDEFIVALGEGDSDDNTEAEILAIGSDKIKIIRTIWDENLFKMGAIYSHETNLALSHCSGDWCFYIQADEAFHEKYKDIVKNACKRYLNDTRIDGFLFNYRHFWGDYEHELDFHGWYNKEIRVIRNHAGILSEGDAQSFKKANGEKLSVIEIPAYMYHYGWVRPPRLMRGKKKEQESQYWGKKAAEQAYETLAQDFNYGALGRIPVFKGTHPAVLQKWIKKHDWKNALNYSTQFSNPGRALFKHEKPKYRIMTLIENTLLGRKRIFGYNNWVLVERMTK